MGHSAENPFVIGGLSPLHSSLVPDLKTKIHCPVIAVLKPYLIVGAGSAVGGIGRYWISIQMAKRFGDQIPVGTFVANITGCFLIGLAAAFTLGNGKLQISPSVQQFLMIGLLGGYTTFSSFSLQTLGLMKNGQVGIACANILLSVILCLTGVWAGTGIGSLLNR